MLDLGSGSPLRFLGDMKTPAVHTCSGALVWFSKDGQESVKLQGVVKGETENVCGKGKREADKSFMPRREIVVHVGRLCS